MKIILIIIVVLLLFSGCAHVVSDEALKMVDTEISFKELLRDPEAYRGRVVLLGGVIIQTKNTKEGTIIVVLQKALDRWGRPIEEDVSAGRFLILYPGYLDPFIYSDGKEITVVGEVSGKKTMPLGEIEYVYPVISPKEMYLRKPFYRELYPYPPYWYDPYWYPYRYGPYWYSPPYRPYPPYPYW
ncbi:MAG: Slp/YeaY family lipoprotein [Nitrospirae bacterium]|nr:Slp/YeaY family lipoprotein [Nitrospirota bacterium]